jgi:hypothetical protein
MDADHEPCRVTAKKRLAQARFKASKAAACNYVVRKLAATPADDKLPRTIKQLFWRGSWVRRSVHAAGSSRDRSR